MSEQKNTSLKNESIGIQFEYSTQYVITRKQQCLESLQLAASSTAKKSRIRLITFHYDNALLHGPAVGNADCRLERSQLQS